LQCSETLSETTKLHGRGYLMMLPLQARNTRTVINNILQEEVVESVICDQIVSVRVYANECTANWGNWAISFKQLK